MKAVMCRAHGEPESLRIEEMDAPSAGLGEVIVDVKYVGLNFHDTLIVAGKHVVQPPLPFSPGSEFSGLVTALGEGVTTLKIGDRVAGNGEFGAARERIAVPAQKLTPLPEGIDLQLGASLLVTYVTAIHAFRQRALLQPGEIVAVLGASGGVGLAAVEIAKLMGARVIACASSAERAALARDYGAEACVAYGTQNLKDELKRLTNGHGVDVVYDPVGGPQFEPALRAVGWNGRYLVVGFASGEIPRVPMNLPLVKGCAIVGVFVGDFMRRQPQVHRRNLQQIFEWARAGNLTPHIHAVLPFEQMPTALGLLARREVRGKVLLKV